MATKLFATISGRREYTDPGEKFENVTMMLFRPVSGEIQPQVRLFDTKTEEEMLEAEYFKRLLAIYNRRNPHAISEALAGESEP